MNQWRGWLVGSLTWQLMACADAPPSSETQEPDQHRSARPGRIGSDTSESTPTPNAAWPARLSGPEASRRPDAPLTGRSDAHPADPEPVVTPTLGWEAARCAGSATRRMTMGGNLDASSIIVSHYTGRPFVPEDPANHANFSTTISGYDDHGRHQSISVYFERTEQAWNYHAIMDGTAFVIGAGHLTFDDQGNHLATHVTQPLRLLTPSGPGHTVELDLTGFTHLNDYANITHQAADGHQARWGQHCSAATPMPDEPLVDGPACAAAATTRFALRANLAGDLTTALPAVDAHGTPIDFTLHLRKASPETWNYQVQLAGDAPDQEVATGALHFNPSGTLRSVTTARTLHFPNHANQPGAPIALDFGPTTETGGNGVDGVTALPGGSFEVWQQTDGASLDCLAHSTTPRFPASHAPHCAGEYTTAIWMSFNLDPAAPLGDSYEATATIYDAALEPHDLLLQFQRTEDRRWTCLVKVAGNDVGVVNLHFTPWGGVEHIENIPALRLPLPDGSAGPPIALAIAQSITSFTSPSHGWLAPNGSAPGAADCVE